MIKSLLPVLPEKNDAFSRIKKFMSNDETGIILTPKEEQQLARWIYCNGLLTEKKFTREMIVEKIREKFGVSPFTARNDINNTYSLFVTITKDYKKYTLFHHIEFLQQKMLAIKDDKSLATMIPKLADSITKAIAALPEENEAPDVPAPVLIINVAPGQVITSKYNLEDAMKISEEMIELERNNEYTEFEELNDGKPE
jgi:hypothetical protein